jgi:transcription-repair coupling factor (superfamily II helicase)
MDVGGMTAEFLLLEYAGEDKLYVPVQALERVSRYTGAPAETAPLHKLGGDQWQKARQRAAAKIRDAAAELLDLYARRAARPGHAFAVDEQALQAFASGFPFEETADQAAAIAQVVTDPAGATTDGSGRLRRRRIRQDRSGTARCVRGGPGRRQVAVLVPTTLLAQQHHQTFTDRFADWPIRIELLSRFRGETQSKAAMAALAAGNVDIVIGTHKLLQPGVRFKDLGLLIIDEEHRFGVRDKERLKTLRGRRRRVDADGHANSADSQHVTRRASRPVVDHDASAARLSIKTFVAEWSAPTVREACLRELRPGGQIYFVHNSVDTIDRTAARLTELVPERGWRSDTDRCASASSSRSCSTSITAAQPAALHDDHRERHRCADRQYDHHRPRGPLWPRAAAPAARPRWTFAPPGLRLPDRTAA